MLQHNQWGIDGWVPFAGPGPPGLMYIVCRNGAQTRQTGFTTSERQLSPG